MLQSKPKDGMAGIPVHLVDEEGLQYIVDRSAITAVVTVEEAPTLAEAALSSSLERLDERLLGILGLGRKELQYGMLSAKCLLKTGAIALDQLALAIPMEHREKHNSKLINLSAAHAVSESGAATQSMRDITTMNGPMGDLRESPVGLLINDRKSEVWMIEDMCARCTAGLQRTQDPNHCVPLGNRCSRLNQINIDREA
mgnify:CR=1 FL=1|tara:strand:+ start:1271 stop:1867 length:597 start_codon:yes stop_codon:yes gene_type:complete